MYAFAGGLRGHFEVFGGADKPGGRGFIDIGMVEQACLEFTDEDPFHGPVQDGLAHPALFHGFLEQREAVRAQVHVHAGVE